MRDVTIRDVLLLIFAAVWAVVLVITDWRTGTIPPELWAMLGVGTGALIAVFRTEPPPRHRRGRQPSDDAEDIEL